jgi:hypothetical protein
LERCRAAGAPRAELPARRWRYLTPNAQDQTPHPENLCPYALAAVSSFPGTQ